MKKNNFKLDEKERKQRLSENELKRKINNLSHEKENNKKNKDKNTLISSLYASLSLINFSLIPQTDYVLIPIVSGSCLALASIIFLKEAINSEERIKKYYELKRKYDYYIEHKDTINNLIKQNAYDYFNNDEVYIPSIGFNDLEYISIQELEEIVENEKQMKLKK